MAFMYGGLAWGISEGWRLGQFLQPQPEASMHSGRPGNSAP